MSKDDGRVPPAPGSREPSPSVSAVPASIPRAGDLFVQDGVGMYIEYDLDSARDPTIERWVFSTNDPDSGYDGDGRFEIRVCEVVETEKSGVLAVYYRQWFAPDDTPLGMRRRKISGLSALRSLIRRRKMVRRDSDGSGEADETAKQAQPEATARAEGIAIPDSGAHHD
jgi:hypothetical protein